MLSSLKKVSLWMTPIVRDSREGLREAMITNVWNCGVEVCLDMKVIEFWNSWSDFKFSKLNLISVSAFVISTISPSSSLIEYWSNENSFLGTNDILPLKS